MRNKADRIVLDTNLWISFLITKDYSKLDKILFSKQCILVFSQELLTEFIDVANRPKFKKYFSHRDIEQILETIEEYAVFVNVETITEISRDSKDNFLLSLSVDGKADFLLTGDNDLLDLKKINKTKIVTISSYLERK
jgi:putative PIN family toxin of toxin-antitoxin system